MILSVEICKKQQGGDVLASQFIIHEKRSKEHLTQAGIRHKGPINDSEDDSDVQQTKWHHWKVQSSNLVIL